MSALATATLASPVGTLQLVASEMGLRAVLWPNDDPNRVPLGATEDHSDHLVLRAAAAELEEYFAGTRTRFSMPLDPVGTPFQQQVWMALRTIPFGKTASYGEIAGAIGRPRAARAVGAANGRNPLSIVVPCHRIVGANGSMTGFAGGVRTKRWLLDHEGAASVTRPPQPQPSLF